MMKSIVKFLVVLLCIIALPISLRVTYLSVISWTHDYTDKVWQPYQVGDSLTFINNKGDSVKWGISEIEECSHPSDPLLVLNHRIFSTFVSTIRNFDAIVHIREESGQKTVILAPRFRRDRISLIENEKNQKNVESRKYNQMDVLVITPHEKDFKSPPYLDSLYWSSQYGFIKVFYSDDECWELKSFVRKGEIIYELKK
ncbi:MAG: hypothetical protein IJS20_07175 [Bacteroidales bacterium]|nr:hypothetical protein [Bacteroidales bacterium]